MDPLLKVGAAVLAAAVVTVGVGSIGRREAPKPPPYVTPAYSVALNAALAARAAQTGASAPGTTVQAAGVELRSVGFELPTAGRSFPPGPGQEVIAANCVSCHTPGMILTQPKLTQAEWTGEVTKMIRTYKAPIDESQVPAIVGYLAALQPGP